MVISLQKKKKKHFYSVESKGRCEWTWRVMYSKCWNTSVTWHKTPDLDGGINNGFCKRRAQVPRKEQKGIVSLGDWIRCCPGDSITDHAPFHLWLQTLLCLHHLCPALSSLIALSSLSDLSLNCPVLKIIFLLLSVGTVFPPSTTAHWPLLSYMFFSCLICYCVYLGNPFWASSSPKFPLLCVLP